MRRPRSLLSLVCVGSLGWVASLGCSSSNTAAPDGGASGSGGQAGAKATGGSGGQAGASAAGGSGGQAGAKATGGSGGQAAPIAGSALFFSDLVSGPNQGGQNDKGAFVTVWGNGLGDARGASTVTVGGGAVDNYPIWTGTKITFQLGAAAQSGNIVVHVAGKTDSNGLPFTVRAGNIYFVTATG